VLASLPADVAFFDNACQKGLAGFWKGDHVTALRKAAELPFARVSYSEAIRILSEHDAATKSGVVGPTGRGESGEGEGGKSRVAVEERGGKGTGRGNTQSKKKDGNAGFVISPVWGGDLAAEHERFLTEVHFKVFLLPCVARAS
jgi:aspartyl/asparaginyl-tRNA synthetase